MLEKIIEKTEKYINLKNKTERKKIGQFFTSKETAIFMANLNKCNKSKIKVLDAGAGTGILSVALLEKLLLKDNVEIIEIDLYENDENILPILEENILEIQKNTHKEVKINIKKENFIIYNANNKEGIYDIVISNPPYKKIGKNDEESVVMNEVVYGQPNLYFLFMAKAMNLLKDDGEMIFIVPRSWTSGAYFKKFRNVFLNSMKLTNIHLFVSRDKVFNKENVLQETMILRAVKTQNKPQKIHITQSYSNNDFDKLTSYCIDYDTCIEKDGENYVFLPIDNNDIAVLETVNSFNNKLENMGLKVKTGLTVDFRNEKYINKKPDKNNVPLFSSIHFDEGKIKFPSAQDESQYITKENSALLQKNTNSIFIKRFSSKEENRRIQPAIFLKTQYDDYDVISTENHINFIGSTNHKEIDVNMIYGLYAIYNSTLYDKYYRILNGSTQVNATEINNIPVPNADIIEKMGIELQKRNELNSNICDSVLMEAIKNG